MDTKELLLNASALTGVSGVEGEAVGFFAERLAPFGKVETTPLGSLLCTVREPGEGEPHILLDAHLDEIGMIVVFIEEHGFLRVAPCGAIDRRGLLASQVIIHAENGPLYGVVCSVPPHLQGTGEKDNQKVEDVYIDTGMEREECEKLIRPGDRVTLWSDPKELLNGRVTGKALDNRSSCVAVLRALEELKDVNCGLTVLLSSMEEVGGMGAKTGAYRVNPTHAVVLDVSFAHTPDADKLKCGELGKGPMVGFSPLLNADLSRRLVRLAEEGKIPYQYEIMSGRTGTNADSVVAARGGVKTALISIPQRYMHSPIEVVEAADVDNTARLVAALIHDIAKGGEGR